MSDTISANSSVDADTPPTFDDLDLSPEVRRAVDELGYAEPTPVQRAVFEPAARGKDLVVQARTGTGKTAAFGLPLVDKLVRLDKHHAQALVLSPTRELALQIHRELEKLGKYRGTSCVAVYGGAPMQKQIDEIRAGAQIVIGTPGRVLDHLRRGTLDASSIRRVILDESDEMLSMGFLPQITEILGCLPSGLQTLLFSATVPPDVRRIAETRLKDPEFVTLSGDHIGALEIEHYVYMSQRDKSSELIRIIEIENPESAIIFCNTRDQTKRIAAALKQQGFAADWLNADLAQSDREKVMAATREGRLRFLVATDVAARGIDISHLTHVINADFPESTENYVHRTGRTGRAGRTGTAISLISPQDIGNLYMLKLTYKIFPIERELPTDRDRKTREESDVVAMFAEAFGGKRPHPDDLSLARRLLTHELGEVIVAGLVRDHLGARPGSREQATLERRAKPPRAADELQPRATAPAHADDESSEDRPKDKDKKKKKKKKDRKRHSDEQSTTGKGDAKTESDAGAPSSVEATPQPQSSSSTDDEAPKKHSADEEELVAEAKATLGTISAAELLGAPASDEPDLVRLFVNVGRRDGVQRADFTDILEDRGFHEEDIAFVKVRDRHTFVGVPPELVERALAALDGAQIAGRAAQAERARSNH